MVPDFFTTRYDVYARGTYRDGDEGNRTPDLLNAIQALSQLSYAPGRNAPARKTRTGLADEGVRNRAV